MTAAAGEVLALGDLCGRNIAAKVDKPYQNGKKTLNLTVAQKKTIRTKVAAARGLRESSPGYLSTEQISFD